LKVPSNVSNKKWILRLVLPIALIVLLLGAAVGEMGHHHANFSPSTCPICHVSHQAVEPSVTSARATILVPLGQGPEPERYRPTVRLAALHIAARAPPVS
jgi:hypothetical protein